MTNSPSPTRADTIAKADAAGRAELTDAPYAVLNGERRGTFACLVGGALLASDAHVPSGPGWPSFAPEGARLSRHQTKPRCAHGATHLGHVFPHAERARTGLRYLSHGAALHIKPGGT